MMNPFRRDFLKGLLAFMAIPLLPVRKPIAKACDAPKSVKTFATGCPTVFMNVAPGSIQIGCPGNQRVKVLNVWMNGSRVV